jgi:murein DD-endopeptidase MepM/ murein hydrolase activator NlpD
MPLATTKFITKGGKKFKVPIDYQEPVKQTQKTTPKNLGAMAGTGVINGIPQDPSGFPIKTTTPTISPATPPTPPVTPTTPPTTPPTATETLTPEQQAEADKQAQIGVIEQGFADVNVTAEQFGLEKGPETISELVEKFKGEQAAQLTQAQQQVEQQNILDEAEAARFQQQAQGAVGATEAAFAQPREGAMAGTAAALRAEFTTEMNKRINESQLRLKMAQDRRNQLILDLEKAQSEGQTKLAEQITGQMAAAQVQIDNAKANVLNALSAASEQAQRAEQAVRKEQMQMTAQTLDIFDAMGSAMGDLKTEELSAMIQGTNLTMPQALAIQHAKVLESEIEAAKTEEERIIKIAQLQQTQANIKKINADTLKTISETTEISRPSEQTNNFTLSGTRTVSGGASNGSGRVNPTELINAFDFGNGQRGQKVSDANGNVVATISSPYGADHSQISGEKVHNGIDMVFKDGETLALQGGTVIKKGFAQSTYGGYLWIAANNGQVLQYGHLNPDDLAAIEAGSYLNPGDFIARQETNASRWGASSGPHTDLRFVGNADAIEDPVISSYGYQILDGKINISNIVGSDKDETAKLRAEVSQFVQEKKNEGYKSEYPVLTDAQIKLVDSLANDYNNSKRITSMIDVEQGWDTVRALFGSSEKINAATGFDDIAAINAFQRMVDPGATVREGDVDLLEKTIPWLERIDPNFKWSQFKKGDKLPPNVRNSMVRVAKEIYNTKAQNINATAITPLKQRAEASGIDNFNLIGKEFVIFGDEGDSIQSDLDFILGRRASGEDFGEIDALYSNLPQ